MKVTKIEISAIQLAFNLYKKGHGLTHAVRMANAKIADLAKLANPDQPLNPDLMLANHQLVYRVKKEGITHNYSKMYNPDAIMKMQKEHAKGKSIAYLADHYGVCTATMSRYLKTVF